VKFFGAIVSCTRRSFVEYSGRVQPRIVWNTYSTKNKGADGRYPQWGADIASEGWDFTALSFIGYTN
jgi:hypothetical protein